MRYDRGRDRRESRNKQSFYVRYVQKSIKSIPAHETEEQASLIGLCNASVHGSWSFLFEGDTELLLSGPNKA